MKEEEKKPEGGAAAGEPGADQKSDKSPEELMGQVANEDTSLDPSQKKSTVDAMADDSNAEKDPNAAPKKPQQKGFKKILAKFNIYLLLFIFILVMAGAAFAVFYF